MLQKAHQTVDTGNGLQGMSVDFRPDSNNPFPGLRPFTIDDCHLYFGREGQVDELLLKLSQHRFITVMGYSGSGKSSLMACGLIPVLYGGFMTEVGPHWKVISTRPGLSPLHSLAASITDHLIESGRYREEDRKVHKAVILSILKRGTDGLIEIAQYLRTNENENIFFLIDQFEEIFRYKETDENLEGANDAQIFVQSVLEAVTQREVPIYAALSMRSDFIGACSVFTGLTQKINQSNYLVPLLSREQKRAVIEGPVSVAGGKITQRLLKRLLSDIGDQQDQLPILQHAMMRTWEYWLQNREPGEAIDLRHYIAIGRISEALSLHANETFDELPTRSKEIAEILFKTITEKTAENRGMRRPARLGHIAQLAEASEAEVMEVVEHFRKPGRSLLMPAANVPLESNSMIELSHESLMRIWNRLAVWVEEEYESASMYRRLSDAAAMYQIGKTGLWRPPDLQLALNWQKKQRPTHEWAQRYDDAFERAIVFLDTSRITYEAELKNQEMMQRRILGRTRVTAIVLGIAFVVAIIFFVFAYLQKLQADADRISAINYSEEANKQRILADKAKNASDSLLRISEENLRQLKTAQRSLERSLREAKILRDKAEESAREASKQKDFAEKSAQEEIVARKMAIEKSEEATRAFKDFNRLFYLMTSQSLALKASIEENDNQLAGLMAMQSFHFHRRYQGREYDPVIYNGLYSALTKLTKETYNAIRVSGPPRVRLTSLIVNGGDNFYASGTDGRIYNGNLNTMSATATTFQTNTPIKVIAAGKDKKYILAGSDSSKLLVFEPGLSDKPRVINGITGGTNDIVALQDNVNFIVSAHDGQLFRVNAATGATEVLIKSPEAIKAMDLHPDGNQLAGVTWSGKIILVNLAEKSSRILADEGAQGWRILSVSFNRAGTMLATGIEDVKNKRGLVRLQNLGSDEFRIFSGHRAGVTDVEFSPNDSLLASAGTDRRLQLYVLNEPDQLPIVMSNNTGFIWDIEFTANSNYLVAGCSDSEIRVWPTNAALMADRICPNLKRNMSHDEWIKHVGDEAALPFENTCLVPMIKDY